MTISIIGGCGKNYISEDNLETKEEIYHRNKLAKESKIGDDPISGLMDFEAISAEEFQSWLPKEILGMKRTSCKSGALATLNLPSIQAIYKGEKLGHQFSIELMDAIGERGYLAKSDIKMMVGMDMDQNEKEGIRKTVERNGFLAVEEYFKHNDNSSIHMLYNDRLYVHAKGINMNIEELWESLDVLKFHELY